MQRFKKYISTGAAAITVATVTLLLTTLAGCSKSDLPSGDNGDGIRTTLSINVTDGGYAPAVGEQPRNAGEQPHTRATEEGYKTKFTAGDKIGLYVVKGGTVVAGCENICLTAIDNGSGGVSWTGNAYYEGNGATYYAYYPYQEDNYMNGKVTAAAPDAAGFFKPLTDAWTPDTDQGTPANYTAQDLMVGSGTVSASGSAARTLTLSLTHQMALAVILTPITKYTLSTDANYTWLASAPNLAFNGFTPCAMTDGSHRYLVNPAIGSLTPQLAGSYSNATGGTQEFAFTPANIALGNYKTYTVDNATVTEVSHILQAGDFYMKDGSLVGKDATLTDAQKASCLGIVFWVGDPTNDDPLLKKKHSGCTHGLIMALHEAGNSLWSSGYEDITSNWLSKLTTNPHIITTLKESEKMQGYANTKALEGYNASSRVSDNSNLKVLPIDKIKEYANNYSAPANSSGWYWPSVKELKYMCWGQNSSGGVAGRDMLNKQLTNLRVASLQSRYYWSSTERAYNWAWLVDFDNGSVYGGDKYGLSFGVRAVVAF